ncbi:hypothetical protein ABW21_db0205380 [Orbilia brochopaga]|nr:hypothetical protein ABW21_db0205380 [Drechslerella brochopaga]
MPCKDYENSFGTTYMDKILTLDGRESSSLFDLLIYGDAERERLPASPALGTQLPEPPVTATKKMSFIERIRVAQVQKDTATEQTLNLAEKLETLEVSDEAKNASN